MKYLTRSMTLIAVTVVGYTPEAAFAQSQDECAIWLCLPAGFPSGCGAAKSAFKKRIKKLKPPLPGLQSCLISSPGSTPTNARADTGRAAFYPEHERCREDRDGELIDCRIVPARYVKNDSCEDDNDGRLRRGCSNNRFVEVFVEGQPAGKTYYY